MRLALDLGARREHLLLVDRKGVIHTGRDDYATLNAEKREFACEPSERRTLPGALAGADVFIGLSGPDLVRDEWLMLMNARRSEEHTSEHQSLLRTPYAVFALI